MKKNSRLSSFVFYLLSLVFLSTSCSLKKAKIDNDVKKYFDERNVEGCFTMMDNSNGSITVYNMAMDTTRYTSSSTFMVVNSLVGLETGRILDENMIIKWDGVTRPVADWNKDLSMKEAFKVSAVPYYQEVARRIGRDTMRNYIDSLSYGNKISAVQLIHFG